MRQKSLVRNAIYNFVYTGMNLFFPLITAPYISRVLGATNLGKVNFANSIISLFLIFAVFGTSTYGIREVAKNRDDKKELGKLFSEMFLINIVFSIVTLIVYIVAIFNVEKFGDELPLYIVLGLSIVLNGFAIDWFYQGIEEYSYITVRSGIFKLISIIAMFFLVKNENDYIIYGSISVFATSLSGVFNFIYSKKFIDINFKNINLIKHIKSLNIFFVSSFIISIYTNLDQTLLGFFVNSSAVAFMARSKQITTSAISVANSISNVTLPRASYYIKNDKKKFDELTSRIPSILLWLTVPISIGCFIMAENIMFILGGQEFVQGGVLLKLISPVIVLITLSTYLHNQILIPTGNERSALICSIISSLSSVAFNILLIPVLGYIGSGIAFLIAEAVSFFSKYIYVVHIIKYKNNYIFDKSNLKYIFSGGIMSVGVSIVNEFIPNIYLSTIISIIVGIIIYYFILILMKDSITSTMLSKLIRKKNISM